MTKKDFKFLLNLLVNHCWNNEVERELIKYFKDKNPRFDEKIWAKERDKLIEERDRLIHG